MKHSIQIFGHSTSFSLEPEFWEELKRIATGQKKSLSDIIEQIDNQRNGNLSSAIRVFVLKFLKQEVVKHK